MNKEELREVWKQEESAAHIQGWDFSHIHGRYEEEQYLPWDYDALVRKYLKDNMQLMDYDTGGDNDRDLVEDVLPEVEAPFPHLHLLEQKKAFENLMRMQDMIQSKGEIVGTIHRFIIVAKKQVKR